MRDFHWQSLSCIFPRLFAIDYRRSAIGVYARVHFIDLKKTNNDMANGKYLSDQISLMWIVHIDALIIFQNI